MEKVSINTTQNVQINYAIAGLSERIIAFFIDIVIMFSVTFFLAVLFGSTGLIDSSPYLVSLVILPAFLYHLILETSLEGQSIGKKAMDIKVVKLDGTQANIGNYLLRWIIWPIDIFFYGGVAILVIIVGGKGQRLGDLAAGTTVISVKKSTFLQSHTLATLQEEYEPVFKEADQLNTGYIDLINQAVKVRVETLDERPVEAMAAKVKEKLGVKTDMPNLKFLHTILKDYHHLMAAKN